MRLLTSIDGVDFEKCFRERVQAVVDGIEVNIISLENLVLNKSSTGRAKDQNDLDNLL